MCYPLYKNVFFLIEVLNRFRMKRAPQVYLVDYLTDIPTFEPCRWTWIRFRRLSVKYLRTRSSSNPRFCQKYRNSVSKFRFGLQFWHKFSQFCHFLIKTLFLKPTWAWKDENLPVLSNSEEPNQKLFHPLTPVRGSTHPDMSKLLSSNKVFGK